MGGPRTQPMPDVLCGSTISKHSNRRIRSEHRVLTTATEGSSHVTATDPTPFRPLEGILVLRGASPHGGSGALHSERAVFDDRSLGLQVAVLAELTWRRRESV